jgi:hypothetical protein
MTIEDAPPRAFRLPLRSITMSERRLMVTKFGINWDVVEINLADIPRPADPEDPTEDEKIAAAKVFHQVIGPIEKFALLYLAVKRELPAAKEADIERHADAGEWVLDMSTATDDEAVAADPLPPPATATT